jgi:hypothetical protein
MDIWAASCGKLCEQGITSKMGRRPYCELGQAIRDSLMTVFNILLDLVLSGKAFHRAGMRPAIHLSADVK